MPKTSFPIPAPPTCPERQACPLTSRILCARWLAQREKRPYNPTPYEIRQQRFSQSPQTHGDAPTPHPPPLPIRAAPLSPTGRPGLPSPAPPEGDRTQRRPLP